MTRTPGTEAASAFDLFCKIHYNLVTIDKNRHMSEAGRGNRSSRSHPFQYHYHNVLPHPHLPSWSDMIENSIDRKKERGAVFNNARCTVPFKVRFYLQSFE